MKNTFPLILATLLGMAAVFLVARIITKNSSVDEVKTEVVIATRNLTVGEVINEKCLRSLSVPRAVLPDQAILWGMKGKLIGQVLQKPVMSGNYIFLDDINLIQGIGNEIGEGEWAVALQISDKAMTSILHSGDEVAIIGTFKLEVPIQTETGEVSKKVQDVTTVLYPKVRILEVPVTQQSNDGEGVIVVQLPPDQAQALIAASRVAELIPVLRRPNDNTALDRKSVNMVTPATFQKLIEGMNIVEISKERKSSK